MCSSASDWHYAGKGVTMGEADTAIFWYRPKDSISYRVIYGDMAEKCVSFRDTRVGSKEKDLMLVEFANSRRSNTGHYNQNVRSNGNKACFEDCPAKH